MSDHNLTVSDYRRIHAKREGERSKYLIKQHDEQNSDHSSMITIVNQDTSIIKY